MLKKMNLTNFKSWENLSDMTFAPITGIFGTNSSGKTAILQFPLLLKQTIETSDRGLIFHFGSDRTFVHLGSFREILHRQDEKRSLEWSLSFNLLEKLSIRDPSKRHSSLFGGNAMTVGSKVFLKDQRLIIDNILYDFAGRHFSIDKKAKKIVGSSVDIKYELKTNDNGKKKFRFTRYPGRAWDLPQPIKCYGFPDQIQTYYQNAGFLRELQLEFENFFQRIFYLGPLRDYPRREYMWSGAEPRDMGQKGERVIDALLASRERDLKIQVSQRKKVTLEEYVAKWLKDLGLISSFSVKRLSKKSNYYQVLVKKAPSSSEVLITDVGFGVSQILPVLALCFYVPERSVLFLEQPEIHLHPSVQSGLADVFIDAINKRNIQIIFESHSEHLLKRLQTRMAEEKLTKDQVSLYFCKTSKEGSSIIEDLDMDEYGNIKNWPKDFFGDEFGEMAAMAKARLERERGE